MRTIKQHYAANSGWQFWGDFAIVLIPVIQGGLMGAPISDHAKYWAGFFCTVLLTAFKFGAKYMNERAKV